MAVTRKQNAELNSLAGEAIKRVQVISNEISGRMLDERQYAALESVNGKVKSVNIMPETGLEPNMVAGMIASALQKAKVDVHMLSGSGMQMTGIMILYPETLEQVGNIQEEPLFKAFSDAGLTPGTGSLKNWLPFMNIPRDVPIVFVGEKYISFSKPPFFGEPSPAK